MSRPENPRKIIQRMKTKNLILITGPTAIGKTDLSLEIAQKLKAEILSADARQFYRELKIGTARPSDNVLQTVPHHFVGHLSVNDYYNVAMYEKQAIALLNELFRSSDYALLVGGSGLYIDTLCEGIDDMPDPDADSRKRVQQVFDKEGLEGIRAWLKQVDPAFYSMVDLANPKRIMRALEVYLSTGRQYSSLRTMKRKSRPFSIKKIVLDRPRVELFSRINQRVDEMVKAGLVEEALIHFRNRHLNALNTVGYKELFGWLSNQCPLAVSIEKIKTNTRRYAKRQLSWFKKYKDAARFHPNDIDAIMQFIQQ